MKRGELRELHYITAIKNISSIMQRGLLSHDQAEKVPHESVAMTEVQGIRARKRVPGGLLLHSYVNLYINARNPMMYKRQDRHQELCILQVSPEVIDLPDVVVTDCNAASLARFFPAPDGLTMVDVELVFAQYWTHPEDRQFEIHHRHVMCAEVLVPHRVDSRYIRGAYVSCKSSQADIQDVAPNLDVTINPYLFFRGGPN